MSHRQRAAERADKGDKSDKSGDKGDRARKSPQHRLLHDLSKHAGDRVQVQLTGGRLVRGVLKGWDPLLNLVLDDAVEQLRDPLDASALVARHRRLGLLIARGTSVITIAPLHGLESIHNPFLAQPTV
ncbi:unnamed protein product [Agarophyton chilense]